MEIANKVLNGVDNFMHVNHSNANDEKEFNDGIEDLENDPFFESNEINGINDSTTSIWCKSLLCSPLFGQNSNVRTWDVLILIPNVIFFLFLLYRFETARVKLRATQSPIFRVFYGLVVVSVVIGIVRCVVSMTVSAATATGDEVDRLLWLSLRLILLATEMSVLVFGLAPGLDSRSSIRRVLIVASFVSLIFTIIQAFLELYLPDPRFKVEIQSQGQPETLNLFGHGGALFWAVSATFFALIYVLILLLPFLPSNLKRSLVLPHKKSFYAYTGFLFTLYMIQSVGSELFYYNNPFGLCLLNLATYFYFTLYAPVVYWVFLKSFFKAPQPQLLFSYKAQLDEFDEEMLQSGDLEFEGDPIDQQEMNTPIVLNQTRTSNKPFQVQD